MNQGLLRAGDVFVGVEVDGVVHGELAVGVFVAVGEEAVGDLDDHLAGFGGAVEEDELQGGVEDEVGADLAQPQTPFSAILVPL